MNSTHPGPRPTKPLTVLAAQALIWVQFTAIVVLYGIGLWFLLAATTAASSDETMGEVMLSNSLEEWILVLVSIGVTVSLPVIATRLGHRESGAVTGARLSLVLIPLGMYIWVTARAYFSTFPDSPEFFIGAGAMLLVCGTLPAAVLLCLASGSARAWFAAGDLIEEIDRELEDASDLVDSRVTA